MNTKAIIMVMALAGAVTLHTAAQRVETTLKSGWEFTKGRPDVTTQWQTVRVPHDWAI